jgi:ribosomal protein S18 acetylase RimI-like enzyme
MNPNINIRIATVEDADSIISFQQAMALETEGKLLPDEIIRPGVINLFHKPQLGFYLVADVDRAIAGSMMITYEWSDWRNGIVWWIQSVYVKPEFRRQGTYRNFYKYVKELIANEPDIIGLRLYVEKENEIAQMTYQSLGMIETHYRLFEEIL